MKSRRRQGLGKIIFITGTDTGVGKTVFTSLLLHHLRNSGVHALAMKPFCSGGRGDVRLLRAMQDGELTENEINPFYFPEPVAPLVSARQHSRRILLRDVVRRIKMISSRCECLLIEGSGGLLVPLGEKYFVNDLIRRLNCEVIIVSRNQLGTINHTLLTLKALRNSGGIGQVQIALVAAGKADVSRRTNEHILRELCAPIPVRAVAFLGEKANKTGALKKSYKKVKKTLARFCE